MAKFQAPTNSGPSISVDGVSYDIKDGFVLLPDNKDYSEALSSLGYSQVLQGAKEVSPGAPVEVVEQANPVEEMPAFVMAVPEVASVQDAQKSEIA